MRTDTPTRCWNHGHALHFHERLSRLTEEQVAFAVAFYRDHDLVGRVLEQLGLREGERVAIEIGKTRPSPHLVVQSDGHFVTCLAAHMSTDALPVVSRRRLDVLLERAKERRVIAAAEQAIRDNALRSFGCLMKEGPNVSRADFAAVLSASPIARFVFVGTLAKCARAQTTIEERAQKRLDARDAHALQIAWGARFALGHLMLMCGDLLSTAAPELSGEELLRVALRSGELSVAVQALHVLAKCGEAQFEGYELRAETCGEPFAIAEIVLALTAIALRKLALKPRALVALRQLLQRIDATHLPSAHELVTCAVEALEVPHAYRRAHRDIGRTLAMRVSRAASHRSRFKWAREEDVPDAVAFPLALREREIHLESQNHFLQVLVRLPWAVSVPAESLYLEAELLPYVQARFHWRAEATRLEAIVPAARGMARRSRGTPWVCTSKKNKRRRSMAVAA